MNSQVTDLLGVYVPTLGLAIIGAFVLLLPVRWLLARGGIYRWFWHRGLVDVSLMVVATAALLHLVY